MNSVYLFDLIECKRLLPVGIYIPVILNSRFPAGALTDYVFGDFVEFRVNRIIRFDIRNLSLLVNDEYYIDCKEKEILTQLYSFASLRESLVCRPADNHFLSHTTISKNTR
jgi:hypothetical protein